MTNDIKYALIDFQRFIQFIMIYLEREFRMWTTSLTNQETLVHYTASKPMPKDAMDRWKEVEKDVRLTYYSYDDCLLMIHSHFNPKVLKSFETIFPGWKKVLMFKLIVMYMKTGIVIDPNVVPEVSPDFLKEESISSYIVVSEQNEYVNMMMMANMSSRHSTLFLSLLLAYLIADDDVFDLYSTLCYNIGTLRVEGDERYHLEQVKYQVVVGDSKRAEKMVDLVWFPDDELYEVKAKTVVDGDAFTFYIRDSKLCAASRDGKGWEHHLVVDIYFQTNEMLYTLVEDMGNNRFDIKKDDVLLIHHEPS